MSESSKVVTRGHMLVILMNVGNSRDIAEPLTVAKRVELVERYINSHRPWPPMEVDRAPSARVGEWVDDAVTRGVLMAR